MSTGGDELSLRTVARFIVFAIALYAAAGLGLVFLMAVIANERALIATAVLLVALWGWHKLNGDSWSDDLPRSATEYATKYKGDA